jgi:hypothetical protein
VSGCIKVARIAGFIGLEECWLADHDAAPHCLAEFIQLTLRNLISAELSPGLLARLGCGAEVQIQRMVGHNLVVGPERMM